MKAFLVLSAILGACVAQQLGEVRRPPIPILSQSVEQSVDGTFNYGFESGNGIQSAATGSVRSLGPKDQAQVVQGSYSYTAPDGTPISARFVADENGFRVEGAHIPTPPPVPAEIARSLQLQAQQPQQVYQQAPTYYRRA